MNEAQATRLALARRLGREYARNPAIQAVMLSGSVAHGSADEASDIDTLLFYSTPPSAAEFEAICTAARGSGGDLYHGTASEGFAIYCYVDGIKCDFSHALAAQTEQLMTDLLTATDLDPIKQLIAGGLLLGLPLHGEAWLEAWRAKVAAYPPALGLAMVRKHLRFQPFWVWEHLAADRQDHLFLAEVTLKAVDQMVSVLCGLNHVYHPGKLKGLERTVAQWQIAPPDWLRRVQGLLQQDAHAAAAELRSLVTETFDLVDTHLPDVATAEARLYFARTLRK